MIFTASIPATSLPAASIADEQRKKKLLPLQSQI